MAEEYAGGFLLIVIENVGADFVAYSPDLPGCVAAGASREEAEKNMDEAIRVYVERMREACQKR